MTDKLASVYLLTIINSANGPLFFMALTRHFNMIWPPYLRVDIDSSDAKEAIYETVEHATGIENDEWQYIRWMSFESTPMSYTGSIVIPIWTKMEKSREEIQHLLHCGQLYSLEELKEHRYQLAPALRRTVDHLEIDETTGHVSMDLRFGIDSPEELHQRVIINRL